MLTVTMWIITSTTITITITITITMGILLGGLSLGQGGSNPGIIWRRILIYMPLSLSISPKRIYPSRLSKLHPILSQLKRIIVNMWARKSMLMITKMGNLLSQNCNPDSLDGPVMTIRRRWLRLRLQRNFDDLPISVYIKSNKYQCLDQFTFWWWHFYLCYIFYLFFFFTKGGKLLCLVLYF